MQDEADQFERAIIESAEDGIKMLPGVRSILDNARYLLFMQLFERVTYFTLQLFPTKSKPNQRWTICTSATRIYATAALNAANIEAPDDFVTADDVHKGKPQ